MGRFIDQKNALVDPGQAVDDFPERADILKQTQVDLYDKRMHLAALDAHAVQQFGGHVVSLLDDRADPGQLGGAVSHDMNEHQARSVV